MYEKSQQKVVNCLKLLHLGRTPDSSIPVEKKFYCFFILGHLLKISISTHSATLKTRNLQFFCRSFFCFMSTVDQS